MVSETQRRVCVCVLERKRLGRCVIRVECRRVCLAVKVVPARDWSRVEQSLHTG